jgi:hypothetical protein
MNPITDTLYQSEPEHPFGNNVKTCAYLLKRPDGNILMFSSGTLPRVEVRIRELGGIARQYLNHRDEASESCDWVRRTFDAPLTCHEAEREAIAESCTVDHTFDRETELHPDLRAIPTPGHCPGSTCYLWQAPDGRRCLFTGDTLFLNDAQWRVFVRLGTNAEMISSLRRIASLEPDVVVPGLFIGDTAYSTIDPPAFKQQMDEVIARLNQGDRH